MIQIIDNFEHRSKLPNFVRDQFDTLQDMKEVLDAYIDEGHISYCIETDKHYKFKANNSIDAITGKWREFKGEKGDKGEDGEDGTSVPSNLTAFIFKSSESEPHRPIGGSWNINTNVFTPPTGWYTTDENMAGTIWMSWAIFETSGTIKDQWASPIRLTGEDGQNGTDGKAIEFIYQISNREPTSADKPSSVDEDGYVPAGWTDHPSGVSAANIYEWMCMRTKVSSWTEWQGPTIWSKWGSDGRDGDGVEYIYKRTITNISPDRPTEVEQDDDFVPEGWTDNPLGVNADNMYEWVCSRKSKDGIWGAFSNPALWAKWGEKGEPGKDGNDGTSINIKGNVSSAEELPESAQPGDAWVVNGDLYVWDGLRWNNVGGIKGPAGDSAYVHIAFADGVITDSDGVVTEVIGFTTSGSINKAYIGTLADHTVADSKDPLDYKWQKNKGDQGDKGDKGDPGDRGPQGVPGPAGDDGRTLYTWIKYANNITGSGISNDPDGKDYIGFAYNRDTSIESNNPSDYTWSKITGEDGVPGEPGADGKTYYTWIKYADNMPTSSSSAIYDIPNDNTKYIGIAINKETATESTDAMLYTWSLFRGKDGTNGTNGKNGKIVYPAGIYDATVTYTSTDTKTPYVLHGEDYWVMNKTTSWVGISNDNKTPQDNYEEFGNDATWIPLEQFEAIYTKILIADNGTLGKFVFNGDYMFSQEGTNSFGEPSSDYQYLLEPGPRFLFTDISRFEYTYNPNNIELTVKDTELNIKKTSTVNDIYNMTINDKTISAFKVIVKNNNNSSTMPAYTQIQWIGSELGSGTFFQQYLEIGENTLKASKDGGQLQIVGPQYNLTIELVKDSYFIPNFQVNAVTGEVTMVKGTSKLQNVPQLVEYKTSSDGRDVVIDTSLRNIIVLYNNDVDKHQDCSLKILKNVPDGYELTITHASAYNTYPLEIYTETSKSTYASDWSGAKTNAGMMSYKDKGITSIYLAPNRSVTLRKLPITYGFLNFDGSRIPYKQEYSWEIVNKEDFTYTAASDSEYIDVAGHGTLRTSTT